jgi:hypothetical protein
VVAEEWLQWWRGSQGKLFRSLNFENGYGCVITGEMPDEEDERIEEKLDSPEMLAVNTLGQFAKHRMERVLEPSPCPLPFSPA